jgi:prevent-host-death family protein
MTTEFSFTDARRHLTKIANHVEYKGKRITVTRKGHRVFAIIPIEDLEALEAIEDRVDLDEAKKALADAKKRGTISWESIKKQLDL